MSSSPSLSRKWQVRHSTAFHTPPPISQTAFPTHNISSALPNRLPLILKTNYTTVFILDGRIPHGSIALILRPKIQGFGPGPAGVPLWMRVSLIIYPPEQSVGRRRLSYLNGQVSAKIKSKHRPHNDGVVIYLIWLSAHTAPASWLCVYQCR